MSDSSRLDALELAVARLTKEVVALRADVRASRGSHATDGAAPATRLDAEPAGGSDASTDAPASAPGTPLTASLAPAEAPSPGPTPADRSRGEPYVTDELRRLAAVAGGAASAGGAGAGDQSRTSAPPRHPASVPPAASRPPEPRRVPRESLEALIGRYGTLALAAFTILMGVGAFIGWAIRNGLIGPEMRVALGALAAVAMAALGMRLRRGDSPRFGNVLLALALAMMHVVCWGAGPLLHLVPDVAALAVAAAASAALSYLALGDEDQSLFNVGFGGALLAPFVTSSNTGDPVLLLLYGGMVLGAGMRAMRDRAWSRTPFVLGMGAAAYTAAASGQLGAEREWARASAPAIFGIAVAWLSIILVQGRARERVAVTALLVAVGALANMSGVQGIGSVRAPLAALVAISGFLVVTSQGATRAMGALVGVVLPIGSWLAAITPMHLTGHHQAGVATILWGTGSAMAAWADRDGARRWHAFTATALGGGAVAFLLEGRDLALGMALAGYAAAASLVMRRAPLGGIVLAAGGWLSIATLIAFDLLDDRARWLVRPFLTPPSGVAAVVCASWFVFAWNWARMGMSDDAMAFDLRRNVTRLLGAVVTFAWMHAELSRTVSLDVSTFLLVAYYAVTGVLAIGIGRARAIPQLRHVGLALAVFAAIKAMLETSSLAIGWRVGGYLLAGVFLLGVAYWYRGRGGEHGAPRIAT